jgi:SWI/SNF-related matrix-associated actin-dependent regulator of chromatin subfamily A3
MVDRNSTPSASQLQAAAIVGAVGAGPSQNRMTEAQIEALQQANMLRMLLNNLEKVDDGSRRESLLDTLCSTQDVLKLPEHKDPPGIEKGNLEVDLLKHQVQSARLVMQQCLLDDRLWRMALETSVAVVY